MMVEKSGVDWDQTLPDSLMNQVQELESSSSEFNLELTGVDFNELTHETNSLRNLVEHFKFTSQSSIGDSSGDMELVLDGISRAGVYHGEIKYDDTTDDVGSSKTVALALSREMIEAMSLANFDFAVAYSPDVAAEEIERRIAAQKKEQMIKNTKDVQARMAGLDEIFKTLWD